MPYLLIGLAIVIRLLPHPFNLAPIGGLGLFAGAYCHPRIAWLAPVAALAAGDALTGFYDPVILVFVYAGMAAAAPVGRLLLRQRRSVLRIAGASGFSAMAFFLISNFGVWLAGFYPPTPGGLVECYLMGLPLLGNTVTGHFVFAGLFIGIHEGMRWLADISCAAAKN